MRLILLAVISMTDSPNKAIAYPLFPAVPRQGTDFEESNAHVPALN